MRTDEAQDLFQAPPRVHSLRRYLIAGLSILAVLVVVTVAVVSQNSSDALAQLRLREQSATFRHASTQFQKAVEGEDLAAGDVVRTDSTGQAALDLFDGSDVRMDRETQVTINTLSNANDARRVGLRLDAGRTWNRVEELTSSHDSFQVSMPSATASVKGTTFITDCRSRPTCYVVGIDGTTHVEAKNGDQEDLGHFECVEASFNKLTHCDAQGLGLLDSWVRDNLAEDQELALATISAVPVTPTPAVTLSPQFSHRPIFVPHPVPTPVPTAKATATPAPTPKKTITPIPTPTKKPKPTPVCTPEGGPDGDNNCG